MSHLDLPSTLITDEARAALAANAALGAGNFLAHAIAVSPAPDAPVLYMEKPLVTPSGRRLEHLSLADLRRESDALAAWYRAQGVRAADVVGVYLDDGVEYLIHYLALVRIGAIGALTNGNMEPRIAAGLFARIGAVMVFTEPGRGGAVQPHLPDGSSVRRLATNLDLARAAAAGEYGQPIDPAVIFEHHAGDPIMIAHSSGTTGIPKAVPLEHDKFFYGIRYRLRQPRLPGGERILSSLPHSHNCAIAYIMLALLGGTPVYITSEHAGREVLKRIEEFRPSMVVSFPQTFVEMTECAMESYDLGSVSFWFNGGDAAHEPHIRRLIACGSRVRDGKRVPGSVFIDGMGSSEMGFSLFRNVHVHAQPSHFGRCVGTPLEWVEAAVLDEDGRRLAAGQIGRLGVRAPSVTTGYWNDSALTAKSRLGGFFLTGDLAYTDDGGRFFHVDRTPDAINTAAGLVYSLWSEERLLTGVGAISDVAVVGRPDGDSGYASAVAFVRLRPGFKASQEELLAEANAALLAKEMPPLAELRLVGFDDVPLGTTGKVLKRKLRDLLTGSKASRASAKFPALGKVSPASPSPTISVHGKSPQRRVRITNAGVDA